MHLHPYRRDRSKDIEAARRFAQTSTAAAGVEPEEDAKNTEADAQVEKELRTVRVQAHHFQNLFLFATRMGRRGAACE